jgi:hypothetical protein
MQALLLHAHCVSCLPLWMLLAHASVDQPTIRATSRILLLEGGSLDRVRNWTGLDHWENRVSSLTAENIAWLDRELLVSLRACLD